MTNEPCGQKGLSPTEKGHYDMKGALNFDWYNSITERNVLLLKFSPCLEQTPKLRVKSIVTSPITNQ